MRNRKIFVFFVISTRAVPIVTLAGHHYGLHGAVDQHWNMNEWDTDGNGRLTVDNFPAPA
jgi:hypothetical protein